MDQLYVGELRAVAFRAAPKGWARCEGQELPIAQYPQLYKVLGFTFGGDGQTTFRLPDLRGRVPIGAGQAPGLSSYALGALGGAEAVALYPAQMPAHSHAFTATLQTGQSASRPTTRRRRKTTRRPAPMASTSIVRGPKMPLWAPPRG